MERGRAHAALRRARAIPIEKLREELAALRAVTPPGVTLPPFLGGAVGLVGYDWVRFVEAIPDTNPDEVDLPDLWFHLPETVVVFDNMRHSALLIRHVKVAAGDDLGALYREAVAALDATVRRLREPLRAGARPRAAARADGRPPQHDARGVPRDGEAREGVTSRRATSSRSCSRSSSASRCRSTRSRSTGICG